MTTLYLFLFILFLPCYSRAQTFSKTVDWASNEILGLTKKGCSTGIGFSESVARKSFWKYCQSFGRVNNRKNHYELVIPRQISGAAYDLMLYATWQAGGADETVFTLTLEDIGLPSDKVRAYQVQVCSLLSDFKKVMYLKYFDNSIAALEKEAEELSSKYLADLKVGQDGNRHLRKIRELKSAVDKLRKQQAEIP